MYQLSSNLSLETISQQIDLQTHLNDVSTVVKSTETRNQLIDVQTQLNDVSTIVKSMDEHNQLLLDDVCTSIKSIDTRSQLADVQSKLDDMCLHIESTDVHSQLTDVLTQLNDANAHIKLADSRRQINTIKLDGEQSYRTSTDLATDEPLTICSPSDVKPSSIPPCKQPLPPQELQRNCGRGVLNGDNAATANDQGFNFPKGRKLKSPPKKPMICGKKTFFTDLKVNCPTT